MPIPPKNIREFSALVRITECLLGEEGCPWDKEQTHESLSRFAIEEAHELAEAIDSGHHDQIVGELGDVLFQVLLHSEIAKKSGHFQLEDVISTLNEKMIRRHPHVFSDTQVKNSGEVLKNWNEIKNSEGKKKSLFETPKGLPSLIEAHKIGDKTKSAGFDWKSPGPVFEKVEEELEELKMALKKNDLEKIEHEIGDLLFSVSQLARHLKLDSEQALRKTNARFRRRFQGMLDLKKISLEEFSKLDDAKKEELWTQVKLMES